MMKSQMELIFGDDGSPLDMMPDEWEKVSEVIATSGGHEQKWHDVTAGVTVAAGKTAYATLRKKFPEDPELVKIVKCAYLEENECFVIKNECFRL